MLLSDRNNKFNNNFNKFARDKGVSTTSLDKYSKFQNRMFPKGMTPMVIEERQMNASTISVFDRLMMDKIIFLGTEIDDYVANIINAQLLFLTNETDDDNKDPLWMYINSPGGDVYSGLAIYDTMQAIDSQVNTCVMGVAASMAFILAISGKKLHRYALKHSRLMQHQPWGGPGPVQASDLDLYNKEMQELKVDLLEIIAKHTGQDIAKVREDCDRDYWMTAKRAKDYGAIDKILLKTR